MEPVCTCQTTWKYPCPAHATLETEFAKYLDKIQDEVWEFARAEGYFAGYGDAERKTDAP